MMNVKDTGAHWPAQPCQSLTVEKCWPRTSGQQASHDHPPNTVQACLALSSLHLHPTLSGQLGICASLCMPGPPADQHATWSDRLYLSIRD